MLVWRDPCIFYQSQLLDFAQLIIIEKNGSPRAVDRKDSVDLRSQIIPDQVIRRGFPNWENAANCEICVDDGATVQWVICDDVSLPLPDKMVIWPLLTCETFDLRILSQMAFDNLITSNIKLQLLVSKLIEGFQDNNGGSSDKPWYFLDWIEYGDNDRGSNALNLRLRIFHLNYYISNCSIIT